VALKARRRDPEIKPEPAKPGYYEVDKTDVNQSNIQMVALGITRKNPDYFATSVFNEAFGGGFSSRLFNDIRTTKGLAYAVGGGVGAGWDHPGMLRLMVSTKSKTTSNPFRRSMRRSPICPSVPSTTKRSSAPKTRF
jgi:predicted Zn-dependent peptidase